MLGEYEELSRGTESPLERAERLTHPWVTFVVLPLFALSNAGVELSADLLRTAATSPVTLGIIAGLVVGKFAGILGFAWLAAGCVSPISPEKRHGRNSLESRPSLESGSQCRCL